MRTEYEQKTIGTKEAACYLGISERTLRRLQLSNKIKYIRIYGKVLYTRDLLDEYLDSQVVGGLS